jgi:hypothetical protein
MDTEHALDDLKVIRRMMQRTRRAIGRQAGWFGVLWGIIWIVGFVGTHFLPMETAGKLWTVLDLAGGAISIWIGTRMGKRVSGSRTRSVGRRIFGWWLTLILFMLVLVWLLELRTMREIALVIVLLIALSYIQMGLFSDGRLLTIGLLLAALVIGTWLLLPSYFFLIMAFLGGGLLIGSGIWFLRSGG